MFIVAILKFGSHFEKKNQFFIKARRISVVDAGSTLRDFNSFSIIDAEHHQLPIFAIEAFRLSPYFHIYSILQYICASIILLLTAVSSG